MLFEHMWKEFFHNEFQQDESASNFIISWRNGYNIIRKYSSQVNGLEWSQKT